MDSAAEAGPAPHPRGGPHPLHIHLALRDARRHLGRSTARLVGYVVVAYLVLKLVPTLTHALSSLEHVRWQWALGALGLELLSEIGFVLAWRAILDPEDLLGRDGRGERVDTRVAWAQLGSGTLVPGGSWGGMGVGSWILHRFGMPTKQIAERQFNLSFLNTAVDALAVIVFGLALASGVLTGESDPLLTILPAALVAAAVAAVALALPRLSTAAKRDPTKHAKIAAAITTLSDAVEDTKRLLFHRGSFVAVFGVLAYLVFDVLVLWSAFFAIHAHPVPGFAVVVMAYIIGALGGSIPLPAAAGTVGGIAAVLVLYGVDHNPAIAAVLLHQAIALLVPLAGGGISYAVLRRQFGAMPASDADDSRSDPMRETAEP
jgi:uncharacterized membrane protein YbhN (UPF0104 family)